MENLLWTEELEAKLVLQGNRDQSHGVQENRYDQFHQQCNLEHYSGAYSDVHRR